MTNIVCHTSAFSNNVPDNVLPNVIIQTTVNGNIYCIASVIKVRNAIFNTTTNSWCFSSYSSGYTLP